MNEWYAEIAAYLGTSARITHGGGHFSHRYSRAEWYMALRRAAIVPSFEAGAPAKRQRSGSACD
jgi:hypothetical protein